MQNRSVNWPALITVTGWVGKISSGRITSIIRQGRIGLKLLNLWLLCKPQRQIQRVANGEYQAMPVWYCPEWFVAFMSSVQASWTDKLYLTLPIFHRPPHHHVMPPARIFLTPLATSPYHSSPLAGLQGYIPYPHIAAVCMFELVVMLLLGHMRGSIGVHHLWAHPCFSCSVLHVCFV